MNDLKKKVRALNVEYGYYNGQLDTILSINNDALLNTIAIYMDNNRTRVDSTCGQQFTQAEDGSWTHVIEYVHSPEMTYMIGFTFHLDLHDERHLKTAIAKIASTPDEAQSFYDDLLQSITTS